MPRIPNGEHEPGVEPRRPSAAPASDDSHLALIFSFFRGFIAFVSLAYVCLIAVLCVHWLNAGNLRVLFLGLLPGLMLVGLNVVAWKACARFRR